MQYFIGALLLALGVLFILKTEWFLENFGPISWAEENMASSGGSRLAYKLLGLAAIFISFLLITNMFNDFLYATIGKIFIRN